MAYDGIFIKSQIEEIKKVVLDEHVAKITMTSAKEVSFHVRKKGTNYILKMNANPNFPHILLDVDDTDNLKVPPAFCMLLRKYLQGAMIKRSSSFFGPMGSTCGSVCQISRPQIASNRARTSAALKKRVSSDQAFSDRMGYSSAPAWVSAAAAGVPDAVTPSPPSTSSDTVAPPIASWRRDFGEVVNIFSLPFKSSMVWRWHAPDNARPCAAFTMAQA